MSLTSDEDGVPALRRNVRPPNQIVGDDVAGHQVNPRPGAREEWRAAAEHDGAEVQPIFVDQAGVGQALRKEGAANESLARELGL